MIYEAVKGLLLAVLRAPAGPPDPPAGSPGSVQVFRASRNYLFYRLIATEAFFLVAIPVGAFADLNFPAPFLSFYHRSRRYPWSASARSRWNGSIEAPIPMTVVTGREIG